MSLASARRAKYKTKPEAHTPPRVDPNNFRYFLPILYTLYRFFFSAAQGYLVYIYSPGAYCFGIRKFWNAAKRRCGVVRIVAFVFAPCGI